MFPLFSYALKYLYRAPLLIFAHKVLFSGHVVHCTAFSHTGKDIIVGGGGKDTGCTAIYDAGTLVLRRQIRGEQSVRALHWSSDGKRVIVGGDAGHLSLYDTERHRYSLCPEVRRPGHIQTIDLSKDGTMAAVGGDTWNFETNRKSGHFAIYKLTSGSTDKAPIIEENDRAEVRYIICGCVPLCV